MDLQSTFYLLGIIFMILGLIVLVGIVVILFYIRKKIDDMHDFIQVKVEEFSDVTVKPIKSAVDVVREIIPFFTRMRGKS